MQRKILIFNTYPIVAPQHGGQKRAAAIVDKYRTLGHQVRYVGVFTRDAYKKRGAHDVIITNQASLDHMNAANAELVGDLATGWISRDDKSIYEALIKNIVAFFNKITILTFSSRLKNRKFYKTRSIHDRKKSWPPTSRSKACDKEGKRTLSLTLCKLFP